MRCAVRWVEGDIDSEAFVLGNAPACNGKERTLPDVVATALFQGPLIRLPVQVVCQHCTGLGPCAEQNSSLGSGAACPRGVCGLERSRLRTTCNEKQRECFRLKEGSCCNDRHDCLSRDLSQTPIWSVIRFAQYLNIKLTQTYCQSSYCLSFKGWSTKHLRSRSVLVCWRAAWRWSVIVALKPSVLGCLLYVHWEVACRIARRFLRYQIRSVHSASGGF